MRNAVTHMSTLGTTLAQQPLLSSQGARLARMERLLRTGRAVPQQELTDRSMAQFKRDLDTLRADFGACVMYDVHQRGYRLLNANDWPGLLPLVAREFGREVHHD